MLELKNLSKSFGSRFVLKNINLTFNEGELVFIVGKSGCGKSTLLNILGGLDSPSSGSIVLDGKAVNINDISYKRDAVSFVFQDFNLISGLDISQNIALSKSNYDKAWISQNVNSLGLDTHQKAQHLSGGEKQRVALLRALYKDSKLILADEPTGNLDSENTELVLQHLHSLKSQGKILIVVTHDLDIAERYGDRIIRLKDGVVESDSRLSNQFNNSYNLNNYNDRNIDYDNQNIERASRCNTDILTRSVAKNSFSNKSSSHGARYFSSMALVKNSLTRHWVRSLCILIMLMIAISFMSSTYNQYNISNNNLFNDSIFADMDMTTVSTMADSDADKDSLYQYKTQIEQDTIDSILNMGEISQVISQYTNNVGKEDIQSITSQSIAFSTDAQLIDINEWNNANTAEQNNIYNNLNRVVNPVRSVDANDFFRQKYFSKDTKGDFLKEQNQVVLDSDTAEKIFGTTDPIGQTIYAHLAMSYGDYRTAISSNIPDGVPVTVVGVTSGEYLLSGRENQGGMFGLVHFDLPKALQESWYQSYLDSISNDKFSISYRYVDSGNVFVDGKPVPNIAMHSVSGTINISSNDILEGNMPMSNELAVLVSPKEKEFLEQNVNKNIYDIKLPIVSYPYADGSNGAISTVVSINGVFESDEIADDYGYIYIPDAVKEILSRSVSPYSLQVYLKDPLQWENFSDSINKGEQKFSVVSNMNAFAMHSYNQSKSIATLAGSFAIIIIVILVIALSILLKMGLIQRKYEIGVLKSLGFSAFKIIGIYLLELLAIAILAFAFSFLFNFITTSIMLNYTSYAKFFYTYPSFWFSILGLMSVFALGAVLTVVFVSSTARAKVSKLFNSAK